ncbi:MAG: hypothetical protein CR977_04025, partial [Gammaproteobacteria bacterium]
EKTLARVNVRYNDQVQRAPMTVTQQADIVYTNQISLVEKATNEEVLADFFIQQSNEANELAIEALDKGDTAGAGAILNAAKEKISIQARSFKNQAARNKVQSQSDSLQSVVDSVNKKPAPSVRKELKANSYQTKRQQK